MEVNFEVELASKDLLSLLKVCVVETVRRVTELDVVEELSDCSVESAEILEYSKLPFDESVVPVDVLESEKVVGTVEVVAYSLELPLVGTLESEDISLVERLEVPLKEVVRVAELTYDVVESGLLE